MPNMIAWMPSFRRFHGEHAMQSAEEVDGFFAALICGPEIDNPSEHLAEIWGETTNDEAFADAEEFAAERRPPEQKIGGNDPCDCGSREEIQTR